MSYGVQSEGDTCAQAPRKLRANSARTLASGEHRELQMAPSSGAARCFRGMCCTFARFLPLRLLWPPCAKVPSLFASRAFGQVCDAPNRRDLPRTQTRLKQYLRYCAGRCSLSRCLHHEGCRTAVCAYALAPL